MKMIFNHIKEDFLRLKDNSIVLVVVLGVSLIPCLYAWFNIAASWDPYTETAGIRVAIANEDEGYTPAFVPARVNIGEKIKLNLGVNDQMDWTFTDKDEAIAGVKSGKYYAAIVIPADFSQKMFSFLSPEAEAPSLLYYGNEKKNAIAPKVTGKGAGAVTDMVKETFTKTLYATSFDSILSFSDQVRASNEDDVLATLRERLQKTSNSLSGQISTLRAFQSLARSSSNVMATADGFMEISSDTVTGAMHDLKSGRENLKQTEASLAPLNDALKQSVDQNLDYLDRLSSDVDDAFVRADDNMAQSIAATESLVQTLTQDVEDKRHVQDKLTEFNEALPAPLTGLDAANAKIERSIAFEESMISTLRTATEKKNLTREEADALQEKFASLQKKNRENLEALRGDFSNGVMGRFARVKSDLDETRGNLEDAWQSADAATAQVAALSADIQNDLGRLNANMDASVQLLDNAKRSVDGLYSRTMEVENAPESEKLDRLLAQDSDTVSRFLSRPVQTAVHRVYPVENYGSAMAAFYSTLSLWVGAVIQVALIHVETPDSYRKKYGKFKPYQTYFGRLGLFLFISFVQSSLIALGDLYFLGIQCPHPFHFLLAGWVSGFIFTILIYTLTISFGDIGKALCVVLMVVQVAGSGGTFPIDVAPPFFRRIYPFLPFVHSMNAMKEAIGGFYKNTFWRELLLLQNYLAGALLLGLVLRKPVMRLNTAFSEKLEDTKIM